jgi:hypothetical protein
MIWNEVENRFLSVIKSTPDNLPDREFRENEKGALPWQCSYCSFVGHCYPDYSLSFDKDNKPILTKNKFKTFINKGGL